MQNGWGVIDRVWIAREHGRVLGGQRIVGGKGVGLVNDWGWQRVVGLAIGETMGNFVGLPRFRRHGFHESRSGQMATE